jgi:hypothetical protein
MSNSADLYDDENLRGGFYELVVQFEERDDRLLRAALIELWQRAGVEGCFTRQRKQVASVSEIDLSQGCDLCGVLELPGGARVVGVAITSHWDNGTDWLYFALPMGALARTDPRIGGFPFAPDFGAESLEWRKPIDDWLAEIGRAIYSVAPFRAGWIGMEPTSVAGEVVPARERWVGYLIPSGGKLQYSPATR